MAVSEQIVAEIINKVIAEMQTEVKSESLNGVYKDMNEAIEHAKKAQKIVKIMSLDQREKIISNIRKKTILNAETLAKLGVEETGMGNVGHKILKHNLVAEKTPGTEDLRAEVFSGDRGLTLIEMGPFGVIGAITPSTNPSETVICNTIGMFASGNTVVFSPHPGAKKTSLFAIDMINKASMECGGPNNICVSVENPTMETSAIMMKHKDIPLLVATGGPGVVTTVLSQGKRGMGAGAGNPPVLVDDTVNLRKTAEHIINGCTFDNNLPCIAEKEVVALAPVVDELMYYMEKEQGCYVADSNLIEKLVKTVLTEKGALNRKCVGKSAKHILKMCGVDVDDSIRCIIFKGNKEHPLIKEELMMPILGIVSANDFNDAVEQCVYLEGGNRHSAHIHSMNVDRMTTYAKAIDTAILVKNGPSYSALGFGGEGYCTFTISSRTGEGLTSAKSFTKSRRCVMTDSLSIR